MCPNGVICGASIEVRHTVAGLQLYDPIKVPDGQLIPAQLVIRDAPACISCFNVEDSILVTGAYKARFSARCNNNIGGSLHSKLAQELHEQLQLTPACTIDGALALLQHACVLPTTSHLLWSACTLLLSICSTKS